MLSRSLLFALLAAPVLHASEPVFQEDFESYPLDSPVVDAAGGALWRITGYTQGESPGQATIVAGEGLNPSHVARTTPENVAGGVSGNSLSIVTTFPEATGKVRFETKLYAEYGSGQVLLRFEHDKTAVAPIQLLFRTSPKVEVVAIGRQEGEAGPQISLGSYRLQRWYQLVITADLEQQLYEVELIDVEKGTPEFSVQGLDFQHPAPAINNLIMGAIFGTRSTYAWDDIKVEKLP